MTHIYSYKHARSESVELDAHRCFGRRLLLLLRLLLACKSELRCPSARQQGGLRRGALQLQQARLHA